MILPKSFLESPKTTEPRCDNSAPTTENGESEVDADSLKKVGYALNIVSATAAFAAAILWFWSTRVEVEYVEPTEVGGWIPGGITIDQGTGKRIDPFATGIQQARWNRWAALAASGAALCQGFAAVLT